LSSLLVIFGGLGAGFEFFTNTDLRVSFLLFFIFGCSMNAVAVFISTLIQEAKTAQSVGYAVILLGFVFQTILCSAYGALIDLLYQPDVATWVACVKVALQFYPPFNFAKAYYDVASRACSTIDFNAGDIRHGPGYSWEVTILTHLDLDLDLDLDLATHGR